MESHRLSHYLLFSLNDQFCGLARVMCVSNIFGFSKFLIKTHIQTITNYLVDFPSLSAFNVKKKLVENVR
jgi:hypothetical protein